MHGGIFDLSSLDTEIKKLEDRSLEENFWNNKEEAETLFSVLNGYKRKKQSWQAIQIQLEDLNTLLELALEEGDESYNDEIVQNYEKLQKEFESLKLLEMLNEEFDKNNAFITIHSGAGGTEACDWVSMLFRMYSRWAETNGFKLTLMDLLESEGGIKSVTFQLTGLYVYGYLKGESGIHRLVRISPFDSNARRHTSFASVYVSPVIDDTITVEIKPDELRIDTYRSQGAGGQHVNTTDSAVRITHLPSGIVVQCQNERSQHKNKDQAMKILKSRLYDYFKAQQDEAQEKKSVEKKEIGWGNQIRSYVFQPYTMVKDHRTKLDIGNISSVMDGKIDPFIEAFLKWRISGETQ